MDRSNRVVAKPALRSRATFIGFTLLLSFSITLGLVTQTRPGSAQDPFPESAPVVVLNLSGAFRDVEVRRSTDDGGTMLIDRVGVSVETTATIPVDVGAVPVDFIIQCSGCGSVRLSIAQGQRIIVPVFSSRRPTAIRSDLHVVNESGRHQHGAIRTGADIGFGRTLLPFGLASGDGASVGLRLTPGGVDFILTCDNCDPQRLRLRNGVDLEVVIH